MSSAFQQNSGNEKCSQTLCTCDGAPQCEWERDNIEPPEAEVAVVNNDTENREIGQEIISEQLVAAGVNGFAIIYGNGSGYMQGSSTFDLSNIDESQAEEENSFEAYGITSHPEMDFPPPPHYHDTYYFDREEFE